MVPKGSVRGWAAVSVPVLPFCLNQPASRAGNRHRRTHVLSARSGREYSHRACLPALVCQAMNSMTPRQRERCVSDEPTYYGSARCTYTQACP